MSDFKPTKPRILLQLDTDFHPSVFDAVVAVDSGVDQVLRHGAIVPESVEGLVHGLMFTRGGEDLKRSAIFIGGSDVVVGEAILKAVTRTFFGRVRVSVLLDSNGANTTAAATVLAFWQSLGRTGTWAETRVLILGAGPVGRRVGRLLTQLGAHVRIGTPDADQATEGVELLRMEAGWETRARDSTVIVAAGPAGVEILPTLDSGLFPDLRLAIDLNAVPPHGIRGIKPTAVSQDRDGVEVWGALGVGGLKMKIHKAAVRALYDGEPVVLDLAEIFEIGRQLPGYSP